MTIFIFKFVPEFRQEIFFFHNNFEKLLINWGKKKFNLVTYPIIVPNKFIDF